MNGFQWLVFLFCLLHKCLEGSAVKTFNMARRVQGFHSYLDIVPTKYVVPSGLQYMNLTFMTDRSMMKCQVKTITMLLRHGGLPLIDQTNFSFPENFVVRDAITIGFHMETEFMAKISISRPLPGLWYISAFHQDIDTEIRQKGLGDEDECMYSYSSILVLGEPIKTRRINVGEDIDAKITKEGSKFSFKVPRSTGKWQLIVHSCDPEDCNISLAYLPFKQNQKSTKDCTNGTDDCMINVASPSLADLHVVEIKTYQDTQEVNISFAVIVMGCPLRPLDLQQVELLCISMPELDHIHSIQPFRSMLGMFDQFEAHISLLLQVDQAKFIAVPFDLSERDIGSTLKWRMTVVNLTYSPIEVCSVLLYDYLPEITPMLDLCQDIPGSVLINMTSGSEGIMSQYIPYPRAGLWHLLVQSTCFDEHGNVLPACPNNVMVDVAMETVPCVDGGCSDRGTCAMSTQGTDFVVYSTCHCDADYQGYACTDATNALSSSIQQAAAYLLTLSNLFFIPSIVIAVRRRYAAQAFVYFYTMFFSTFYHACDGERLRTYKMCMTKYDVLQLADFFGSSCSIWLTVVAMASIPHKTVTSLLEILGPMCLFIGVIYDRRSLWLFSVPLICGFGLLVASWGYKMYRRRRLYPSLRRYLMFLVPGIALAILGGALFAFLETTGNYKYVHSFWHISIALSVCFLLPPKQPDDYVKTSSDNGMSSHLLDTMNSEPSPQLNNGRISTLQDDVEASAAN